jgi:LPXTG-motif cell wall-anchored protein
MTTRSASLRRTSRALLVGAAGLGLLLAGIGPAPAVAEDELPDDAVLQWSELTRDATVACEPERPLPGETLTCRVSGAAGFEAVTVTFGVLRLLDEYDEGQLSETIQEQELPFPIAPDGTAILTVVVSDAAAPGDVYDLAGIETSTTACYAAVPLVDDDHDAEDGYYLILAGPGALTLIGDGEEFEIDGLAFASVDAEPICEQLLLWAGGEVGGIAPPDDEPSDDQPSDDQPDEGDLPAPADDEPDDGATDGSSEAPADAATPDADATLPRTGGSTAWLAAIAALALGGGLLLIRAGRRAGRRSVVSDPPAPRG